MSSKPAKRMDKHSIPGGSRSADRDITDDSSQGTQSSQMSDGG